ncbi:MAG TPA: MFS transporter [Pseudolabrys sp.]|nr:MFS transporter [Pseudolabrys sp.]
MTDAATQPRQPLRARPGFVLAVGFVVLFIGGGARFTVGLTLKPMVEEFGWLRGDIGQAVALFQVISALAMFAAGNLVDRMSPRLVLSGGILLAGIGIGAMSVIYAPWHALVLYGVIFAIGNGVASVIPVGVMVTRAFPKRTGIANAVVMSGMSVGQLVVIAVLAAVLLTVSWQSVYLWLGIAHLALVPLLMLAIPGTSPAQSKAARPLDGLGVAQAARTKPFWLLIAIYAICGFDDFFVSTHVVAFAQDRGVDAFLAGNLLAVMGLMGLIGVVASGAFSDRAGPIWPTALCFIARAAVSVLVLVDKSTLSVTIFALVFGITFLVTAPLCVVFVLRHFGPRHLGSLTGLITMIHHMCGGVGAYLGAASFDATGNYDLAFMIMLALSFVAALLTFMLRKPNEIATA